MIANETVERLLRPVIEWMADGGDAWLMNLTYWETRRQLMDAGESFAGSGSEYLSNVDSAMDAFNPDPDRTPYEIDESELRRELNEAIGSLRDLGLID